MYAHISDNSFWSVASCKGQLHWVSYRVDREDTTFAAIEMKEHALKCNLRIEPQEAVLPAEQSAAHPASAMFVNVDLPLIGRYLPQWSNTAIPFSSGSEEPVPCAEQIQEVSVPYWCPLIIVTSSLWGSIVSLRAALRRVRLAQIGRGNCGNPIELAPTSATPAGIPD
jgi:hypothetical protein